MIGVALSTLCLVTTSTLTSAQDTLLFMRGNSTYVNPVDAPGFSVQSEDLDGLAVDPSTEAGPGFDPFVTTDTSALMANDTDTAYLYTAASRFDTPGCADNWLEFGPISIPDGGARLWWTYRGALPPMGSGGDGYEIRVSNTGMDNYNDFVGQALFTKQDDIYGGNPSWYNKTALIDGFWENKQVYIAFHHTTCDMFRVDLDDILLVEETSVGVEENAINATVKQNFPNPFSNQTVVQYAIQESAPVTFIIRDVTGKEISRTNEGTKNAGNHFINVNANTLHLQDGIYFYELRVGEHRSTHRMVVAR